jgi:transcriptional regulator with XRE-family HTH domain
MEMQAEYFQGRLRELREEAGLSREQLAERAGIKASHVRDLEQGVYVPNWTTVVALCKALGKGCDAFLQKPADLPPLPVGRPKKKAEEPAKRSRKRK